MKHDLASAFEILFRLSPAPTCLLESESGRILFANDEFGALAGLTPDRLDGLNIQDVVAEGDEQPGLSKCFEGNWRVRFGEAEVLTAARTLNVMGKECILLTSVDVSRGQRPELLNIVKSGPIGVLLMTLPDTQILEANDHFCNMLGYSKDETLMFRGVDLLVPEDQGSVAETCRLCSDYQTDHRRYVHKDGSIVWAKVVVRMLEDREEKRVALAMIEDLSQQHAAVEKAADYEDRLRRLIFELVQAEDRERKRLSEGLHDGVAQVLALSKLKISKLLKGGVTDTATKELRDLQDNLDYAIELTRSLIFELRPPTLSLLGLRPALEWLVDYLQETYGLETDLEFVDWVEPSSDEQRSFVFQIVRELMINVIKHSEVLSARVSMRRSENRLLLSVSDQGVGFDPADVNSGIPKQCHLGLISLQERITLLGGAFEVQSQPGHGCAVHCIVIFPTQSKS